MSGFANARSYLAVLVDVDAKSWFGCTTHSHLRILGVSECGAQGIENGEAAPYPTLPRHLAQAARRFSAPISYLTKERAAQAFIATDALKKGLQARCRHEQ